MLSKSRSTLQTISRTRLIKHTSAFSSNNAPRSFATALHQQTATRRNPPPYQSLSSTSTTHTRSYRMAQRYMPENGHKDDVVRLMVLETDEPHPETQGEKGSFGEILHHHMSKAGEDHHPPLGIETDQVYIVTEHPHGRMPNFEEFDGFDGLLITGSMFDAHGDNQWIKDLLALLKELWVKKPDFHFTGVCFGHQVLSRLLGAEVGGAPSGDWELGHSAIDLNPIGQRLFRTTDSKVFLHQMHQDQVISPPSHKTADGLLSPDQEVHVWGSSEHTKVQGLYIANRLFTTQAHLAFDENMVKRQIQMRVESGGIQDLEHADRAAETADLEHDGQEVAKAILRLFRFDDDGLAENGKAANGRAANGNAA